MNARSKANDRIIFLAFCVLQQAIDACRTGPLPASMPVRLALATLYAISDGDRDPYDQFWRCISNEQLPAGREKDRSYVRTSYARTYMARIAKSLGFHLTVDLTSRIKLAARGAQGDHEAFAAIVRSTSAKLMAEKERARRGRDCPLSG